MNNYIIWPFSQFNQPSPEDNQETVEDSWWCHSWCNSTSATRY